jgi:hypothetical protein
MTGGGCPPSNEKGIVMAKHRTITGHSLRARTLIGGMVVSGALLGIGAPGIAAAGPTSSGPFHFHSPAVQQQESAIKLRIVQGIESSRVGSAYATHLATQHPATFAKVETAIGRWISH